MKLRRSLQVAVVSAALVLPLAAFAQIVNGSVTTDPAAQPAPALVMPLLLALAIALIGVGAYSLRTRSASAVAGFVLLAGLSVLAGFSYAGAIQNDVVIEDGACNTQTISTYEGEGATLTSHCPNPIRIVAIDRCSGAEPDLQCTLPPSSCAVGQILTYGQECGLPPCAC